MTAVIVEQAPPGPVLGARSTTARDLAGRLTGPARVLAAIAGALVLFGVVIAIKGANPFSAYKDMFTSTFTSWDSIGGIMVRATPIMLAALAVTAPARAGLINPAGAGARRS